MKSKTKQCSACLEVKDERQFKTHGSSGYTYNKCRFCSNKEAREKRAANPKARKPRKLTDRQALILTGFSSCYRCKEIKPVHDFHKSTKEGVSNECKACRQVKYVNERSVFAERNKYRHIKKEYGLSKEEHTALTKDKICPICKANPALFIDHCHRSGKVREALCRDCNSGLGFFKEDPDRFISAIQYIRKHNEDSV